MMCAMTHPNTLNIAVVAPDRRCARSLAGLAEALHETSTHTFTSANEAIAFCTERQSDLVLLGHPLPRGHSASFMAKLRANPAAAGTPVLMLAPSASPELRADAYAHGADAFLGLPIAPNLFAAEARTLVAKRRSATPPDVKRYLTELSEVLATRLDRERDLFFKLLGTLVSHDGETSAHCLRVGFYAHATARALGLPSEARDTLLLTAPLHDMGKVLVAPEVIGKRGKFEASELAAMRRHPDAGRRLLAANRLPLLAAAADVAGAHHERWDGAGYPDSLAGAAIPLGGRIVAIADVFDALVSTRSYKRAWSLGEAIDTIIAGAGTQFDPECVRAFCEQWDEIRAVHGAFTRGAAAADAYVAAGVRKAV
jgi:response regulator RpfG family c-di-GMP phosphodiesterase